MDKITKERIQSFLNENKLDLKPTQKALSIPIVNRLYHKMMYRIKFDDIKIFDDLIIDGHHRYLSAMLAGVEIGNVPTHKTSATTAYDWGSVELDEDDWDTSTKIQRLNMIDAAFNNIDLKKLIEIVK